MVFEFKKIEEQARKVWEENKEEIKLAMQNNPKKKIFSFLEGPPTANAPPGLHHLEVRTFKDIICKFKFMKGFSVPRKGGWDCHGLPVEVQVEKQLGLNSKKDILNYGQNKFIDKCRESVFSNIDEWNKSTEELAYWVDLENPYRTLDNDYIESVWWSLKELYKKKLLYEGNKVVPFCPRCSTPLSSHEVSQGYKEVKEKSVIVKFQLEGENKKLLVWTTTPWTLPSNLALAVNPNLNYSVIEHEGELLILTESLIKNYFENPTILETLKGEELIGKKYIPLMSYFQNLNGAFKIIGGDFVTTEDGTGIVHMAPAFGEVDYDACRENEIPFVNPIDQSGKFTSEVSDFEGKFIKDADKDITLKLNEEGKVFKVLNYKHDYPFCWRCESPLMYYAINSWFVKTTAFKDRMIELNKKINWVPKHIQEGRFGMWLENIKDWNLSRFKFWGTPLPIWRCECGKEKIIGSIEELKKESINKFEKYDLHRPWIDEIKLKCDCNKEMIRIPDVIDCWYDSGSATFAQFHYPFENKKEFNKRFPYQFISEAIDQTRGWFYTLHALSTILFDDLAYENVICAGHILDGNGEKMSKSKGNILFPREIFDSVGVDAVRLQMCITDPGNSKRFSLEMIKENVLPFLNVLYNCRTYYLQLKDSNLKKRIEDKWIISKLEGAIRESEEELENYSIDKALQKIIDFVINDFSRTYIRITRDREDNKKIVGEILEKVSLMLAPYTPYISEFIYQEIYPGKSVHLSNWPKQKPKRIEIELENKFQTLLEIIELGLRERDKNQVGLKWPLQKLEIFAKDNFDDDLQKIIRDQLNIKEINFFNDEEKLRINLDFNQSEELQNEGYMRELSRKVQAYRKEIGLEKNQKIILIISSDKSFLNILNSQRKELQKRTNSKKIIFKNFSEGGLKLKNVSDFKIKDKKGQFSVELLD